MRDWLQAGIDLECCDHLKLNPIKVLLAYNDLECLLEAAYHHNNSFKRRTYVDKHSEVMRYLYNTEQSEINAMIETLKRLGRKENS